MRTTCGRIGLLLVACATAGAGAVGTVPPDTLPEHLPLTVPPSLDATRPVPADNPLTEEKIRLGRRLFFDPILSEDKQIACATCHQPSHAFSNTDRIAIGAHGVVGKRRVPSLLNRAYGTSFFWDGREPSLESQALRPIASPSEMASSVAAVVERLRAQPDYRSAFRAAFHDDVTAANLAKALASFERVLLSGDSRVDRFRAGNVAALNESERHGLWLYESRGHCWHCHSGRNFTDESYHNTGVSWGQEPLDAGRHETTKQEADRGRFKTPTLRDLVARAPYMHDGSFKTLEEVVEFYNRGGNKNPHLDRVMEPLELSKDEVVDLVAFLKALSGPVPRAQH